MSLTRICLNCGKVYPPDDNTLICDEMTRVVGGGYPAPCGGEIDASFPLPTARLDPAAPPRTLILEAGGKEVARTKIQAAPRCAICSDLGMVVIDDPRPKKAFFQRCPRQCPMPAWAKTTPR